MSYYTQQKDISFANTQATSSLIPDNGASVAVEFWSGSNWVADSQSPVSTPSVITTQGMRVRFTPTGGGYFIDEAAAL